MQNFRKTYDPWQLTTKGSPTASKLWAQASLHPDDVNTPDLALVFDEQALNLYNELVRTLLVPFLKKHCKNKKPIDWLESAIVLRCRSIFAHYAERLLEINSDRYQEFAYTVRTYSMLPLLSDVNSPNRGYDECFHPELQLPSTEALEFHIENSKWLAGFGGIMVCS